MRMLQPCVGLLNAKVVAVASGVVFPCYGSLDGRVASLGIRRLHGLRKMRFQEQECRLIDRDAVAGGGPLNYSRSKSDSSKFWRTMSSADESSSNERVFCIIEGPETVQDFVKMELQEIRDNIKVRRNKIFLLMEEVRRLRIQKRIKNAEQGLLDEKDDEEIPEYPSSIPFFPPITTETLKQYYAICLGLIAGVMLFGGLLAPMLELKLGLGGSSYKDFIQSAHLPMQLSQVDPIVASFSGGAVGVISALMVVEMNNVKQQEHKHCKYCHGTGYLACARCSGTGSLVVVQQLAIIDGTKGPLLPPTTQRCPNCSGAAKVMCPTCLCTGMALASEHDPRIDPFD